LKESGLNFVGNVEARDIPYDACDVIVADGFTGNIILKLYEGVAGALMKKIKGVFTKSLKTKLAAAVIKKDVKQMAKQLDANEYGGAPFLGVKKPVFKAHGNSKAQTFCNAIGMVMEFARNDVIGEITNALTAGESTETEE
ncbi:MAG: phosphate--acyl-ACP acyltransferase, partial [Clostridia bacterium]|nr:phosphate--acyl-ACP acyltransferase [Clostridia bacterium]